MVLDVCVKHGCQNSGKPGKPGKVREFIFGQGKPGKPGKVREFCLNSSKNYFVVLLAVTQISKIRPFWSVSEGQNSKISSTMVKYTKP